MCTAYEHCCTEAQHSASIVPTTLVLDFLTAPCPVPPPGRQVSKSVRAVSSVLERDNASIVGAFAPDKKAEGLSALDSLKQSLVALQVLHAHIACAPARRQRWAHLRRPSALASCCCWALRAALVTPAG